MTTHTLPKADIDAVPVDQLHTRLGFDTPLAYPPSSLKKPLTQWNMETDDSPIFRYIYRHAAPSRHLEFGTWLGTGATYCLEESPATVWTINLPDGEARSDGTAAYPASVIAPDDRPAWLRDGPFATRLGKTPSDVRGLVGLYYHKKGFSHRVCQILCDSRQWDTAQYPPGFFDTALVDGGHAHEIVTSDTQKTLPLVRPGGVVMWHDYCPDPHVNSQCPCTVGVVTAIADLYDTLRPQLADLFWVKPSWILVGIKARTS